MTEAGSGAAGSAVRSFIALGTNLGDRIENLRRAVTLLGGYSGVEVTRSSRVYETAPVGPPQPDYLNAVVEVRTSLSAPELLRACLAVETEMGRVRQERWGPRVIDLDVLTYGSDSFDEPHLRIPHPRMHERAFVLVPLLELEPDPMLPGGRDVTSLRSMGGELATVRLVAPPIPLPIAPVPGS